MSTVKTNNLQLGQSLTATNNFSWYQPSSPDGTVRLGVGNAGATTSDVLVANSSGNVGIGTSSPSYKLDISKTTAGDVARFTNGGASNKSLYIYTDATYAAIATAANAGAENIAFDAVNHITTFATNSTVKATLDSSGNLGLGVTPSGWGTWSSVLQGNAYALTGYNASGNVQAALWCNSYRNSGGTNTYYSNGYATQYLQGSGAHQWFTAPSGTAGNAISFTQAMTLDASGNLLVGTTSSPTGSPVGKVLALSGVDIEGTAAINVTTSTTLLSRTSGVGGMFFVQGYNASGGAQGWWLLACIGATLTTIASNNATGLTVTFSSPGGGLRAVTASGTLIATCVAFTM